MRIAITGSHGVGKTTLIEELIKFLNKKDDSNNKGAGLHGEDSESFKFKLLQDAAREAIKFGFPINENTTIETEFWIIAKHLEMEMEADNYYITDKCFVDLLVYAMVVFKDRPEFVNILKEIAEKAASKYDLVIYIPAGEFPIEDDGVRSPDPDFQMAIDKLVLEMLNEFNINYTKITGSKEERFNKAQELINKFIN